MRESIIIPPLRTEPKLEVALIIVLSLIFVLRANSTCFYSTYSRVIKGKKNKFGETKPYLLCFSPSTSSEEEAPLCPYIFS